MLVGLAFGTAVEAGPATFAIDPARSRIVFHAESRFMNAEGHFGHLEGHLGGDLDRPETMTGQVVVSVASLDTGIHLRDEHLRSADFLDVSRHPQATFQAMSVRPEGARWLVTGALTIRGVTRTVAVPVAVAMEGQARRLTGEFSVSRRAFGVRYDSILNPIADTVRVVFDLLAGPE